jgi:hypothetical protein
VKGIVGHGDAHAVVQVQTGERRLDVRERRLTCAEIIALTSTPSTRRLLTD